MSRLLVRVVLGVVVLLGVGAVGATWLRHATTPDFHERVRAHPVADEVWRAEEGIAYQVRCGFQPTWTRTEGGASGAGVGPRPAPA